MERYFYAEILEQKRQKERQLKNQSSKLRLQEIASGSKTQWSGNILHDLKGVNEAAKAILDPKHAHDEYEELLSHHDIIPNDVLKSTHYKLINAIDPYYQRMFNRYLELMLLKKEEGMLRNKLKQNRKNVVTFHEEIKSLTEELIRLLKPIQ